MGRKKKRNGIAGKRAKYNSLVATVKEYKILLSVTIVLVALLSGFLVVTRSSISCVVIPTPLGPVELCDSEVNARGEEGFRGLSYLNKSLGFEVSAPNIDWYMYDVAGRTDIDEVVESVSSPNYLGGVVIQQGPHNVMIIVQRKAAGIDLAKYADQQIERSKVILGVEAKLTDKWVSHDGAYVRFEGEVVYNGYRQIGIQILRIIEDRVYLIQSTFTPDLLDDRMESDLLKIIDSIRFLEVKS